MKDDLRARIVKAYVRLGGNPSDEAAVSAFLSSIQATIESVGQFTIREPPLSTQRKQVLQLLRRADAVISAAETDRKQKPQQAAESIRQQSKEEAVRNLRRMVQAYSGSLSPDLWQRLEQHARRLAASIPQTAEEAGSSPSARSWGDFVASLDGDLLARAVIAALRLGLRRLPHMYRSLRRSKPIYESCAMLPAARNGRPVEPGKILFVGYIAIDVAMAIPGKLPSRWRRTDDRGPFADLVAACFEAAKLSGADAALRNYLQRLAAQKPLHVTIRNGCRIFL